MTTTNARVLLAAEHLEAVATEVATAAAAFVRQSLGDALTAGTKSTPTDVVTETDLASERLIRAELQQRCPGSAIVGEEYGDQLGANNVGWIVDPIDGTVNFLYALPVVSVSIAATVDGEIVAGAVADVLSGEAFSAARGLGARRNGSPIAHSGCTDFSEALVGTGFAYEASVRAEQAATLTKLLPACRDIRCMGSAALNLCWVGAGLLDGYFERDIKLYDYAAGALIAAEGGAAVETPATPGAGLTFAVTPALAPQLQAIIT